MRRRLRRYARFSDTWPVHSLRSPKYRTQALVGGHYWPCFILKLGTEIKCIPVGADLLVLPSSGDSR